MAAQENLRSALLNQPIQILHSRWEKWTLVIFVSLFIPLFLLFFQPFGVNNYDPTQRISGVFLFACCLFGLISGLTLLVYEFWLAPLLFRKTGWQLFLARITLGLILVATTLFLLYNILGNFHDWHWRSYLEFIGNVLILGLIPMSIILLYLEYRKLRRAYVRAKHNPMLMAARNQFIRLASDNGKEHVSVIPHHLLFIEAQGNYVFVYHLEHGTTQKTLLRTTMKKLERQMRSHGVIRCHRSFLVNTQRIAKVAGNAHQLQLHLDGYADSIPVSRSYISAFEKQLVIHPV